MILNVELDLKKIDNTLDSLIKALRAEVCISDEDEFKIKLIVKELLTNILSYANANEITLNANMEGNALYVNIMDNGTGFNYKEIMQRDVTSEDFLMCNGGRGIFLVRMMADKISFNESGNIVNVRILIG